MLTRWYFVGAFSPFFRGHAKRGTERREPYLSAEPYKSIIRGIIRLRYSLLPVWYTAFRESSVTGLPVTRQPQDLPSVCPSLMRGFRPQYIVLPKNESGFSIDDQYYIGSSGLLVKPITAACVTETTLYIGEDQVGEEPLINSYRRHLTSIVGLLRLLQRTCLPRFSGGSTRHSTGTSRTRPSSHSWWFHLTFPRTSAQFLALDGTRPIHPQGRSKPTWWR